jgi:trk system potassium uptake protein TrkH
MIKKPKLHIFKIVSTLGMLLQIPAFMAFFSIIIAIVFKEYFALLPLILISVIYFILGQILYRKFKNGEDAHIWDAMIIASIGWALCSFAGSFIYFWIAKENPNPQSSSLIFKSFSSALFESVSGFTSTGLTMIKDVESLPHILQWWRSFQEWVGGMGLIVFIISIIEPKKEEYRLYYAEGKSEQIGKNITETTRKGWLIYFIYTVLIFILFLFSKMPLWDSVNHALTSISTGGFSVSNESFFGYSLSSQVVAILAMFLGCMSFCFHYRIVVERKFSQFLKSRQHLVLLSFLILGSLVVILLDRVFHMNLGFLSSIFQWVSSLATCGFSSIQVKTLFPFMKLLLVFAMIIGGASGSTAGGIKMRRFLNLLSSIFLRIKSIYSREGEKIITKEIEESAKEEKEVADVKLPYTERTARLYSATVLFSIWLISLLLFWFLVMLSTHERPLDVFFDISSAISNVGLSTGIVDHAMPLFPKILFMILMWIGRLEIIPVIMFFSAFFIRRKKRKSFKT